MYRVIKRIFDFVLSLVALVVLSPLFLILVIAIKLDSRGPILFKQKRVGIHKTHFNILKFRTMKIETPKDAPTHLLENPDQWITSVGKFLRKTSLDELPQIFNIFIGQMSIVGPRPALWNQYDLISERDKYGANDVPVGLTGWAQINGRDELEIDASLTETELAEYCRRKGIYVDDVKEWQEQCLNANEAISEDPKELKESLKEEKEKVKDLKRELRTKEKALAETAALLVLRKKANAIVCQEIA